MDASTMFPYSFHPIKVSFLPDMAGVAPHLPRIHPFVGVKYYFTNFSSALLSVDALNGRELTGCRSERLEFTEPFKEDVRALGEVLRTRICNVSLKVNTCCPSAHTRPQRYDNVGFMERLVSIMTQDDPSLRPNARATLLRWHKIRRWLVFSRPWRLQPSGERLGIHILLGIVELLKLAILVPIGFVARIFPYSQLSESLLPLYY